MSNDSSEYWWQDIKQDIEEFILSCIHCIISRHGEKIPRSLPTALHGKKPNVLSHADFLYMGPAEECNLKYVLIVKHDVSSYTGLCPCNSADSDTATTAIGKWITCFGETGWLETDQCSHFKAILMHALASDLHIKHYSTIAYCPWASDTVELVRIEVLRVSRV